MTKGRKIALACVNAALLVLLAVCVWRCRSYETTLASQQAAKTWTGESRQRFAQVSCFFPDGSSAAPETVNAFRKTIDAKLADAGLGKKDEGSYWTDAYAAIGSLSVSNGSAESEVTSVAVGGSFFAFHPYRLLSGNYISEDDLMQDRVVIDHELAWKLFGGTQLAGQTVKINGKPFYIAGVIERENDKFTSRALAGQQTSDDGRNSGTPPLLFLSYKAYTALNDSSGSVEPSAGSGGGSAVSGSGTAAGQSAGGTAAGNSSATNIQTSAVPTAASADLSDGASGSMALSCYEIVLPDPITKFAANLVSDGFKAQSPVVVENSARYRFANIWSNFKTPGTRSVVTSPIVFPYWENAARVSEDYVAREYVFIGLLAVFPLVCLVWLLVLFIRFLTGRIKILCFNIWDAWDDRYGRKQAREQTKAMRQAVIEAVESGELPPEELPPETAEEKFEAFFGKAKQETEKAGEKTKSLLHRKAEPTEKTEIPQTAAQKRPRAPKTPKLPKLSGGKKAARKKARDAHTQETAASLLSECEQMDVERIVQEVLDEEAKQNRTK